MNSVGYRTLVGILALSVFVCFSESRAEEKIAARVNGVAITEKAVQDAIDEILPSVLFHKTFSEEARAEYRPQALDQLIRKELFSQEAAKRGEPKVAESEIDAQAKKVRKQFRNEKEFNAALAASGYNSTSFREEIEKRLLAEKFEQAEIIAKSVVSEEETREYYEKNKTDFMRPEARRIRHILIKVPSNATEDERKEMRKKAEEVLEKARKGEDFAELATKYSQDDYRVKGGDLGLVHRGRAEKAVEEAAFGMEVGAISDIINSIYGYHIVKVEGTVPPTQLEFEEMKPRLLKQLQSSRKKQLEMEILDKLKADGKVEIY